MAATIGLAEKYNLEYAFPENSISPKYFPRYFNHLPLVDDKGFYHGVKTIVENGHGYNKIGFQESSTDNIILDGYWQSYKYWYFCIDKIRRAFNFDYTTDEGIVGIHWRFGDYRQLKTKHPIMTERYMLDSINYFLKRGWRNFIFYSDEIYECKDFVQRHFPIRNFLSIGFSENKSELQDFESLMKCQHQIISNSSFSLMAALLNAYPEKIVISPCPDEWYGSENSHLETKDMIPESWIKITQ
ncbi:MAG: alpha-1,2-fucosyltransferase [Ferruginibacter sp.]